MSSPFTTVILKNTIFRSNRFEQTLCSLRARVAQWVRSLDLTTHTSLSPIRRGFAPGFVNYKKRCTRLAAASDKVYQMLAHGRWFSPCTSASSTTKTGRHNIAEILLKVALKHQKSINQSINQSYWWRRINEISILFGPSKMFAVLRYPSAYSFAFI
jgi:hypothetical protein